MKRFGLLVALLVGCAPSATVKVETLPVPAAFATGGGGESAAEIDARALFADDVLSGLIDEALKNNRDLLVAVQRIEIARAGVQSATGARLPQVDAVAGLGGQRFARYTLDGSGAATTDITPGRITPNPVAEMSFGLQASWEADLWGRLRHAAGAARARYLSSIEGTNLVITNLVADVAATYFELLAFDHVATLLAETAERQAEGLAMMRVQKEAGRANELAVQQFEAQLATTEAMRAENTREIRDREARLNLLLGRYPGPIPRDKDRLARLSSPLLTTGVPSAMLRNRPDIREAELAMQAAKLDVSSARAAFYPSISITANVGYAAFEPKYLLRTPDSLLASLAGNLVGPLINRRAIAAEFATAQAQQVQAMYDYQARVLGGFAEVASGLATLEQADVIITQRERKATVLGGAVDTADVLFRAGKATYLDVLLAQQNTLEARLELIEALRDQNIARLRLYKALGGGWRGVLAPAG